MWNLDIKQAELAIEQGRLDEAFSLLRQSQNRKVRRGQELLKLLADALVNRGHEHLASSRLASAGSDAAKAVECAGQKLETVELLEAVARARETDRQGRKHQGELLAAAENELIRGNVSCAGRVVDAAEFDTTIAHQLAQRIDVQREVNASRLDRARRLIDGQHAAAIEELSEMVRRQPDCPGLAKEISRAVTPMILQARGDLEKGRLDRVQAVVAQLSSFLHWSSDVQELQNIVQHCRDVRCLLESHSLSEADVRLGLLAQLLPGVTWIANTRAGIQKALSAINELRTGPLGLLNVDMQEHASRSGPHSAGSCHPAIRKDQHNIIEGQPFMTLDLPRRLLLQIDCIGSVLMLTSSTVSIGGRGQSANDVPLLTDGVAGTISVHRDDADYMLSATPSVKINEHESTRRLLEDGDRISIGSRGRIVFRKPVLASSTACLELTGAGLKRADIRAVAMLGDSLMIGPSGRSHFVDREADSTLVLYRDGSGLAIRDLGNGGHPSRPAALTLGETLVVGATRIKVSDFTE